MESHDIAHSTAVTEARYKLDFELTKETPYLAITNKLHGVDPNIYIMYFREHWPYDRWAPPRTHS